MFWPGTEAAIGGVAADVLEAVRQDSPRRWIASSRRSRGWRCRQAEQPSFVSLYFDEVDTAGHDFGPDSPQLADAAAHLDAALGALVAGVRRLGLEDRTTIVVVSDHGMTPLSYDRIVYLDALIDLGTVDVLECGANLQLNPRDGDVDGLYRAAARSSIRSWRSTNAATCRRRCTSATTRVFRRLSACRRMAGRSRPAERLAQKELGAGDHGYRPGTPDMGALFVAAGPSLRRGHRRRTVRERARLRSAVPDSGAPTGEKRRRGTRDAAFPALAPRLTGI